MTAELPARANMPNRTRPVGDRQALRSLERDARVWLTIDAPGVCGACATSIVAGARAALLTKAMWGMGNVDSRAERLARRPSAGPAGDAASRARLAPPPAAPIRSGHARADEVPAL